MVDLKPKDASKEEPKVLDLGATAPDDDDEMEAGAIAVDILVLKRPAFLGGNRLRAGRHDVTGMNLKLEQLPPDATLNGKQNPSWRKRRKEEEAKQKRA